MKKIIDLSYFCVIGMVILFSIFLFLILHYEINTKTMFFIAFVLFLNFIKNISMCSELQNHDKVGFEIAVICLIGVAVLSLGPMIYDLNEGYETNNFILFFPILIQFIDFGIYAIICNTNLIKTIA